MKSNPVESGTDILERAKTAQPYSEEELCIYDDDKDPARILATMAQHLKELGLE